VVKEIVDNPAQAKTERARNIEKEGQELEASEQGEIKATVDSAVTTEGSEFKQFSNSSDYVVVKADKIGGGNLAFFRHRPQYAVMEIQGAKKVDPLPGGAPPPPAADPAKPGRYIVLERNLGAMRQPPLVMSSAFGILFALSLYVMHTMERTALKEKQAAELEPSPSPA